MRSRADRRKVGLVQQGDRCSRRGVSPALVVAIVALLVALGGTAVAVTKIGPRDIARDAVRAKHMKAGQVRPKHLAVTRVNRVAGEYFLNYDDIPPGKRGPRLAVSAKRGDLILVHARAEIQRTGSELGACIVRLDLTSPNGSSSAGLIRNRSLDSLSRTRYAHGSEAQGTPPQSSGTAEAGAEAVEIPVFKGGRYRFELRYGDTRDFMECRFRDRALWVGVLR